MPELQTNARTLIELGRSVERPVRVLAIDGPAGSGKTTFAAAVAAELEELTGSRPPVVHTDDLCEDWDGLPDLPDKLTAQVLEPLTAGQDGRYRRWDWVLSQPGDEVAVPAASWVLVEGVGSGARVCRPHLAALAWLETDVATRHRRAIARDGDDFAPYWDAWAAAERELFTAEQTRAAAQLVIRT